MRQFIACLALGCFAVVGYAQEGAEATESPKEVTQTTEESSPDVAVAGVDSHSCGKKGGCGCGKSK